MPKKLKHLVRLQSWFKEKHDKQVNLDASSKQEVPQLLKRFFLEIRQTTKENKRREYEPGTLEFEEVLTILSMKNKDLKQKGCPTR